MSDLDDLLDILTERDLVLGRLHDLQGQVKILGFCMKGTTDENLLWSLKSKFETRKEKFEETQRRVFDIVEKLESKISILRSLIDGRK